MRVRTTFILAIALASAACTDDGSVGAGTLVIAISGEEASRGGYPVGSGDEVIAFEDGWTLEFQKVVVSLANFTLKTSDGEDAALESGAIVADLHQGEPELWKFEDVPARRWDRVGYRYTPPSERTARANEVEATDLERMANMGWSLYIEATAQHGERNVRLQFGFPLEVEMSRCIDARDETDGVVVEAGGVNEAQITVHLDHLFFDSYATDEAALRFEPMAAVAQESGLLQLEDLRQQDNLSDLVDAEGQPLDLAYDPGSSFDPVPDNLEQYVMAAATTTGHWNGEGHCVYERVYEHE